MYIDEGDAVRPLTKADKAIWLEALRSGKYKQGVGQLRRTKLNGSFEYCCLGVANDVLNLGVRGGCATLWSEDDKHRLLLERKMQVTLWRMNDLEHMSFAAIADYIEANINPED
jgi:hypothetical protein